MSRTGRGTRGPQRRTKCRHMPTGTVSWPLDPAAINVGTAHASVYSCAEEACVIDAAVWVQECTGTLGVYRDFAALRVGEAS